MASQSKTVRIGIAAAAGFAAATLFSLALRSRESAPQPPASGADEALDEPVERSDDEPDDARAEERPSAAIAEAELEVAEEPPAERAGPPKRGGRKGAQPSAAAASTNADVADPAGAVSELMSPPAAAKAPEPDEVVARVIALGPQVLPQLIGVVCGDVELPAAAAGAPDAEIAPLVLEQRERIARDAIAQFGAEQQLAAIVAHATGADVHERLTLIQLLGPVDHPDALPAILDVAGAIEPIDLQRSYVREPIETALVAQLAKRHGSSRKLIAQLEGRDPALLALLGRACVGVASLASGELVTALFGRSRAVDAELFDALAHVAPQTRFALPDEGLDVLRRQLDEPEVEIRRAATIALGALRDDGAVKELIALLSADDPRISGAARWSLRSIAGADRGANAEAWEEWLADQTAWHEERAPELIALLESEKTNDVVDGLSGLIERPCFRRETVAAIEPLLARQEPAVFRAAVSALESIGSARAAAALENSLSRCEAQRRAYVAAALKRMAEPRAVVDSQRSGG